MLIWTLEFKNEREGQYKNKKNFTSRTQHANVQAPGTCMIRICQKKKQRRTRERQIVFVHVQDTWSVFFENLQTITVGRSRHANPKKLKLHPLSKIIFLLSFNSTCMCVCKLCARGIYDVLFFFIRPSPHIGYYVQCDCAGSRFVIFPPDFAKNPVLLPIFKKPGIHKNRLTVQSQYNRPIHVNVLTYFGHSMYTCVGQILFHSFMFYLVCVFAWSDLCACVYKHELA